MAIILQDAIKLGCSGGQGKIQIQTLFNHAAQLESIGSCILATESIEKSESTAADTSLYLGGLGVLCGLTCFTIVENPLQIDLFFAKQSQFSKKSNGCKLNHNKGL